MATFTRGERKGKPSRLTTGILVLPMLLCSIMGACRTTPEGRHFLRDMTRTAAGTLIQEGIAKEMWSNDYRPTNTVVRDRKVIFSEGEWTYHENGTAYNTKMEAGQIFRMENGKWVPVPNGTPIFYFQ